MSKERKQTPLWGRTNNDACTKRKHHKYFYVIFHYFFSFLNLGEHFRSLKGVKALNQWPYGEREGLQKLRNEMNTFIMNERKDCACLLKRRRSRVGRDIISQELFHEFFEHYAKKTHINENGNKIFA